MSRRSTQPSHLLFDFFGTLVDYTPTPREDGYTETFGVARSLGFTGRYGAFIALWQRHYVELEEVARVTHREFSMLDLSRRVLADIGAVAASDNAGRLVDSYLDEWNVSVRPIDGVRPMLERLSERYTLSIITNTHDTKLVPAHLQSMGIAELFSDLVTSVAFGYRKPAPAIFEHAVGRLGIEPSRGLYVGDNPDADYAGATGAGLAALLVGDAVDARVPASRRIRSIVDLESQL